MKIIDVMKNAAERLRKDRNDAKADMVLRGIVDHHLSPAGELFEVARGLPAGAGADLIKGMEAGPQPERIISRALTICVYDGKVWVPSEWIAAVLDECHDRDEDGESAANWNAILEGDASLVGHRVEFS